MARPGPWRLIVDHNAYADFSVSVSPAIERAVAEGASPPTVFLDIFDSDSVTIGVNEDPEQVLDLDFCRRHGILFRRRPNGGGPVYAGAGSAFLVYYLPTAHLEVPQTTAEAFPKVLTALAGTASCSGGAPTAAGRSMPGRARPSWSITCRPPTRKSRRPRRKPFPRC